MQMERERNGNGGDYCYSHRKHQEVDHVTPDGMMWKPLSLSPARPSTPPLPPSCSPVRDGVGGGMSYIEHRVSKMDTLAGVAIKYGVEVADIKRINGLVTDLQMFALKTLHIPLPGRHPPSPSLSNGFDSQGPSSSEKTPCRDGCSDLLESFQSLKLKSSPQRRVSSAMSELQGFYGLNGGKKTAAEGFEMAVYRQGGSRYLEDGPLLPQSSPLSNPPLSLHRKSRSVANGFWLENSEPADDVSVSGVKEGDSDNWNEKLTRRRQKSVADFSSHTPETLLKEDNSSSGGFSAIGGKGLANRSKAANRTASGVDGEACLLHPVPTGLGDSLVVDIFSGVRKSSSTPSLQDQENGTSSSNRPTSRWSLKPDLPISSAAITKPMFDGLPNPITGRRNKAALD